MKRISLTKIPVIALAGAIVLTGCASNGSRVTGSTYSPEALEAKNEELLKKEAELARREAELGDSSSKANMAMNELLPPNGKAGECYARVWVEPTFSTSSKEIVVKDASNRVEIIPAQYETVKEQVLVSEASSRYETIPTTYKTITEQKLVSEGGTLWRVALGNNAAPASQELLDRARKYGADLDSAAPLTCFHEHFEPAKYETVGEQVLVSDAHDHIDIQAAEYRWVEKAVVVREVSTRLEKIPAVYETVYEQVVDVPAHTVWKKGTGPIQRIDEATGEIMCLVDVPTTYKTVASQKLVTAATSREITIPAVTETVRVRELVSGPQEIKSTIPATYKTVQVSNQVADASFVWHDVHNTTKTHQSRTGSQVCLTEQAPRYETVTRTVVDTQAVANEIAIPAEYKTVTVRKLVSAAQEELIETPAEYNTITLREKSAEGFMEWRSILCETNMDITTISEIQRALKSKGYNPGPIDGVVGVETMQAVNSYQRDNNFPVDAYLNIETVRSLGAF